MSGPNGSLARYLARRWCTVPVHRPDPQTGTCSCGKPDCAKPGKHPDGRHWPEGSTDPAHFTDRNVGVRLGPDSQDLADVDLDCHEAVVVGSALLPTTDSAFGRQGRMTHALYTVPDRGAAYLKLQDPVLAGERATIVELRWPEWDEDEGRYKNLQTVFPPSLHHTGGTVTWLRDGTPAVVPGADLVAAVRQIGAAVLLARYAKLKERHALVLLLANLLVRAGWADASAVRFIAAVFTAKGDEEKVAKINAGEGLGAVKDARKRLKADKPMTGLPALKEMLDPALDNPTADKLVATVKDWLGIPDPPGPKATVGAPPTGGNPPGAPRERYTPIPPYVPFPTDCLPAPWDAFVREGAAALRCDEALVALPLLAVLASAVGNTRRVHLGAEWYEPAVLWTCVVAESGGRKSPAAELGVERVKTRQKKLVKEFKDAVKEYKRQTAEHKARKKGGGEDGAGDEPHKPTLGRVLVSDVTIEKLAGLLDDNRRGLLVYRDELAGWVGSFTKYKGKAGGSDEPNWLSIHRGDAIIYDRKTGEKTSVFVPHAAVSVCGGIQPGVLKRLASHDLFDSGMVARLIFAMPPRTPKTWSDDRISEATKEAADESLAALYGLSAEVDEDGDARPVVVGLTREARERLKGFVNEWGLRQFEAEGERAAALAKLEALPGRFALLRHCVLKVGVLEDTDPIGVESLEAGIELAWWCAHEAERVYALIGESVADKEVRKLVEAVTRLAARHGGKLTTKHLQNSNSRKYPDSAAAQADLERLVGLGLGRWEEDTSARKGGHRPTYFVPAPRPDSDSDSSDPRPPRPPTDTPPRPADVSDPRPEPAPDCPGAGGAGEPESRGDEGVCDEPAAESPARESEESESDASGEAESIPARVKGDVGSEGRNAPGPTVGTRLVADGAGLAEAVERARGAGRVGLDLETTGLSHARDRVRLLSLATPSGTFLVDLFRVDPAPLWPALAATEVVGHNLGFDLPFLMKLGFVPGRVRDTMLTSQVLHAGDRAVGHSLKDLAHRHIGVTLDKEMQTADWSGPLGEAHLEYAARDAELPPALWEKLTAEIAEAKLTATVETEMAALPAVAWAATSGVGFDRAAWEAVAAETEARAAALRERLDELVPNAGNLFGVTNWNSPDEVAAAFGALGIALDSTDDDALAALDHPAAAVLREYRAAAKLAGTYGREWLRHVAPDGRVYATWKQIGAGASGRMSCKEPNLQQLPRDLRYRRCFVAPPGRVLVKADYSQIELRIAAKITADKRMLDAYHRGEDLHTTTARAVLGKTEVTKADRQLAKSLNFGLLYGMGAKSLAAYAASNFGVALSVAEATKHREAFFRTYPGLRAWHRRVPDGTLQTRTLAGRRRVGVSAFTEKLNTPTQGTGADGLKRALALLWDHRDACPGAFPVLLVHDEVVVECDEARQEEAAVWVRDAMKDGMAPLLDPVPVEVEVSAGRTWGG